MWKFIVSNVTFKGVLWGSLGLALLWFLYSYTALTNELSNVNWELAGTKNKLESANYSIEQMKLYETQRKEWNKELDTMTAKFKKELDGYSLTLKGIANERSKNGVNNSLSEPVTRVLKQFNNQ